MIKLIRTSTIPSTTFSFCKGLFPKLKKEGYEVIVVSSPGKRLQELTQRDGVRTIAVPMERRISPIKDIKSLWLMCRVLRHENPDIVHSMTPKAGLITMVAAWLARVPIRIHTFTGLVFPTETGLKRCILMATDRLTCVCATHIIPEGEGVKADLLNNRITNKPIHVLGHGNVRGLDLSFYCREAIVNNTHDLVQNAQSQGGCADIPPFLSNLEEKIGLSPSFRGETFSFVFVGRIVRDKGINELVAAFKRLHEEFPHVRLLLVGHYEELLDPIKPETKTEIEQNLGIKAVGSQKDVRPYYLAADALVLPSYREGFPNVVLEAGAMGLPSIVTDINGSREIIIEGRNGTIIPPQDEEALYQAMRYWVTHRDEVARMSEEARPLVASRFEQGYVHQCLIDFYSKVRNAKN